MLLTAAAQPVVLTVDSAVGFFFCVCVFLKERGGSVLYLSPPLVTQSTLSCGAQDPASCLQAAGAFSTNVCYKQIAYLQATCCSQRPSLRCCCCWRYYYCCQRQHLSHRCPTRQEQWSARRGTG